MLSRIQFNNQNHTQSIKNTVIPPINRFHKENSDSVSFCANRLEITPVMQDKFAMLHKKVSNFFIAQSKIDSITRNFGKGQTIEISEGISNRCVIIICDVVERSKKAVSGRRYIIRDTGRVQKQQISGAADAQNISSQLVGARPFLENKNEAKRLYSAINFILNTKINELNDLPKVPNTFEISTPESFRIPEFLRRAPSRPPRYPFQTQPELESRRKPLSEDWKRFVEAYNKLSKC